MNVSLVAPGRAWVLLGSGRRLDLLDPQPHDWTDQDLAISLSRTYRWGGHSRWDLPLSVAQHSLLVLVMRQQLQPDQPLMTCEALWELLHDAEEGLLGFDPISPLKAHLGKEWNTVSSRLQNAIASRYRLVQWSSADHYLHKQADQLAAASEAFHVTGWSREAIRGRLQIKTDPVMADPLPLLDGMRPWQPWPARTAAALFLAKLRELQHASCLGHPADLTLAIEREATLTRLGGAFSRLPPGQQRRCAHPIAGNSLTDTFVFVESPDQHLEGVIVDGDKDENGQWVLDGEFTVFTTEEDLVRVSGWACTTEVQ